MDVTTQSMLDGLALPPEEIIPENVHEKRTFTLRNLKEMPMFGYGCGVRATFREEVAQFAYESCGVRLFDTSSQYGTEDGIRRVCLYAIFCHLILRHSTISSILSLPCS